MAPRNQQDSTPLIERIVSFELSSIDKDTFQMTTLSGQQGEKANLVNIDPMLPSKYPEFNAIRDQYIRAGGVPLDEEFTLLKTFKEKWDDERSQLYAQVDQTCLHLNQLYTSLLSTIIKIRQTEVYSDMCTSLRAPIRNLPAEILSDIFYFCIPENKSPRSDSAPLDLRRVCKFWNDVVLGNGRLWNRIRFDIDSKLTPIIVSKIRRGMAMYRSGPKATIPFSLALFTNTTYGENFGLHNQIMPLILRHLPHCNHLYLGCTNTSWYRRFSSISSSKFSALESLYINFKETSGNSGLKLDCFTKSPNLKAVTLILWKSEHIPQFGLPYGQLSRLCVSIRMNLTDHPTPISSLENLVKQCPNLEFLQVDFQHHHADRERPLHIDNADSPPTPTTLSSLRTFKFATDFSGYLVDFVKAFEFPLLTSLSVDALHPFHLSPPDGPPLVQLFQWQGQLSFFAGLVELELLRVSLNQEEIQDLLEATMRLEKLTMMNLLPSSPRWGENHCLVENDALLQLLVVSSSSPSYGGRKLPLVPRLTNLHLFHAAERDEVTSPPFPLVKLAEVVKTRTNLDPLGEFKSSKFYVHITFEGGHKKIWPSVVDMLRDEGVHISFDQTDEGFQKNIDRSYHYFNSIHPSYPL